jgi:hypothetical protein
MYRRKSKTEEEREKKEARVLPGRYLYTVVRSLSSRNTSEYSSACRVITKGSVLVNVLVNAQVLTALCSAYATALMFSCNKTLTNNLRKEGVVY